MLFLRRLFEMTPFSIGEIRRSPCVQSSEGAADRLQTILCGPLIGCDLAFRENFSPPASELHPVAAAKPAYTALRFSFPFLSVGVYWIDGDSSIEHPIVDIKVNSLKRMARCDICPR